METLQSYKTHLLLLFLSFFSSLQFLYSAYTPPNKYFINCGSKANINDIGRTFVGDMNSSSAISFSKPSSVVKYSNQLSNTSQLYETARIFRHPSSYEFETSDNGTYVVRLHFLAFFSQTDGSTASFDVSASGFSLLHDFTVQNNGNSPLVKEFLLSINVRKFVIYFTPGNSSFALVNAIEVFLATNISILDKAPHVSPKGRHSNYTGIVSKVLHTVHRINVGGPALAPDDDTLWRNWVPDDTYLYNNSVAKNCKTSETPNYQGKANEYIAPDVVYQTAKEMNINSTSGQSNSSNITWLFVVSKNDIHFVRVHFSDIVSKSLNTVSFNLYFYSNFSQEINPYEIISEGESPFFFDFVVDSDSSGLLNISIGPRTDSPEENAFLNGLEIMEITERSVPVPILNKPQKNHVFLIVASVLGGLTLICILLVVLWICRKPRPVETSVWSPLPLYGGGSSHSKVTEGSNSGSGAPNLNLGLKITFPEIQYATNNFDRKLLIGKGGFGNVYRGTLRNRTKVAVKRSEPGSGQGLPEFQTEIMVLSKIRHRHLVSLIGYCDVGSEMILVYEFMEKGTLRDHLYNSNSPCLSWKQRLEICIGAARGLHYLHTGSVGGIIHRDVKSTNILLDKNYVAKVADFGLSRSAPLDQFYVSTAVKGTFGYLDPEYFRTQQLTDKSDVYSFGVVLLEVLCARTAINPSLPRDEVNLAEWGMLCKRKGLLEQIVDPLLMGQINPNSLRKFGETAEKCLQEDGADRPTMGDVVWDLEYALQLQQTAMCREPHEDSTTDASSVLSLSEVRRFPSISLSIERDDMPILKDNGSDATASEVFSQLRIDDAR